MQTNNLSLKNTARLTGLLYFLVAVSGIVGYFVLRAKYTVNGNIAATAEKMIANESIVRSGIAISAAGNILFLITIIYLYHLLKRVHEVMAKLMMWFAMVAIPVLFVEGAIQFTTLYIFKGDLLKSFQPDQAKEIAASLLNFTDNINQLITVHWGLWLLPMGWLVYKSRFIPRLLGVLLCINGMGYMISSITFILVPDRMDEVTKIVYPTYFIGELPLILWLLIKGVKNKYAAINNGE